MGRIRHACSLAFLAGLMGLAGCGGSGHPRVVATGREVPGMSSLDQAADGLIRKWNIPGVSLAVSKGGRLVYARGFGYADLAARERVRPESRFRLASVSKTITAVTVMKLVEDGRLRLDQKVFGAEGILNDAAYLEILDERVRQITLGDLLQHSGGWNSSLGYDPQYDVVEIARTMGVPPPADGPTIIRYMLRHQRLDVAPGREYHYSNLGYNILGRIIEKTTGLAYETHVRTAILDPAGATGMCIGGNLLRDRMRDEVVYHDTPDWPLAPSVDGTEDMVPNSYGGFHLRAMDAHGGWIATASDLLRYATSLEGFPGRPRLLRPETVKTMTTVSPEMAAAGSSYALGWVVDAEGRWNHTGALTTGTFTYLGRRPDGVHWALLCNRLPVDAKDMTASLTAFMKDAEQSLLKALDDVKEWPAGNGF